MQDGSGLVWRTAGERGLAAVVYAGEPMRSDADYTWRVRARGGAWAQSSFGTGLLERADHVAAWVEPAQHDGAVERWELLDWIRGAGPSSPPEERLAPVQLLRQRFAVDGEVARARLYATARGVYEPHVNGAVVGDEMLAPGFDSYAHRISVQCYDVTHLIGAGENVLGVALADGWWAGRIGLSGANAHWGTTRTAAWWQVHLEYADGRRDIVRSGADVRSRPGPWRYADLFIGELFDAREAVTGWDAVGHDDSGWSAVTVAEGGRDVLVPFTGEPVRRVGELPAASVSPDDAGAIVDFGQVLVGRVRLAVRGARAGQRIVIEHTEVLDRDGSWFRNIDGINKEQTDVYVAAGRDVEVYEPTFTFHGFRYVRVAGLPDLVAGDITAVVLSSDLADTGSFECSDPRLNRLHQNVVWSQRGNFLSIPTDCPQRERAGWTGDIQVFARAATNNMMVLPFLERWLANLRADQYVDGSVPISSPWSPLNAQSAAAGTGIAGIDHAAGWSDAIAIVPWVLWEAYGDPRVLEENWDAILRWVEYQRATAERELPASLRGVDLDPARTAHQALLYDTGDHFGDWLAPSTLEGRPMHEAVGIAAALTSEYIAPMFQAQTLTIAARIADVLGRPEAGDLADRAQLVREAFAREYVDASGDLPVRLQGVYVLALAFDMVPAAVREQTAARLVELVHERGDRLDTGFLSVPYLLDVLWDAGHRDLARRLLWQDRMPSWLYEVDHGATTVWESWDSIAPDGQPKKSSLNHYAFGCVDDWLFRRVAGIRPVAPGGTEIVIDPDFACGLTWAKARITTVRGPVSVQWRLAGGEAVVEASVPPGVRARLAVAEGFIELPRGASTHSGLRPA